MTKKVSQFALAAVVHRLLHILDDAEENAQTGEVIIEVTKWEWKSLNDVIDKLGDSPHDLMHDLMHELRSAPNPAHETRACVGCERGLPLDDRGHHYGRISNTGPLAPYYLDLTVCTAQNGTAGDCIACSVGNPGVYIKEGRMICPHRPDDSQVNGGVKT